MKQFATHELPPLIDPVIHEFINLDLMAQRDAEGDRPTADGSKFRASYALDCARQIGFDVLDIPRDIDVPPEVLLTFDVGHRFHQRVQGIIERQMGGMSEVVCSFENHDVSCHADAVYTLDPETNSFSRSWHNDGVRVVVEIKTISGFGWLLATGGRKSDEGAGPKVGDAAQAAIAAISDTVQAQFVHLIYIDKDKQGIAEWIIDIDEPQARYQDLTLRELAEEELQRFKGIAHRLFDEKMLPSRHIPGFGRVESPPSADSRLEPWNCRYCGWQPTCKGLVSMPVPLDALYISLGRNPDGTESDA